MASAAHPAAVRDRRAAALLRAPRRRGVGVLAAAAAVVLTTLVIFPLRASVPVLSTGVVYLVAVLVVSSLWGLKLGLATSIASALAFNYFHIPPTGRLTIDGSENLVALCMYFVAAVIASTLGDIARTRAVEAELRREEADLAAALARLLLSEGELPVALRAAAGELDAALALHGTAFSLDPPDGAEDVPLELGAGRVGHLRLPAAADAAVRARVRERVAPALEALLRAALERERLQAEVVETAALRRSDVIKTALLRAVSHDLRTPLTAINAAGEALRSEHLDSGERDELATVVLGESARLARLVDNLLDLSRLQAGVATPRRDWCSIEEVVEAAAEQVRERSPVPIELVLDRDLPFVQADAAQLERVLVNLLDNAVRYASGHPVKVRARVVGGKIKLRVIDRGPGLAPEDRERIFEAFQHGPGGGLGLGLAIVRGFVEANGGHVRAESLPGQGTVFAIELPLADPPEPAVA